jgi:hypothetical protein
MARSVKQRRKDMLRQWKERERATARAALPLPDDHLQALFDALDREVPARGCDHTRRLTREFLERDGLPVDAVFAWLDQQGAFCDCEVLANVEEHWLWCRDDS